MLCPLPLLLPSPPHPLLHRSARIPALLECATFLDHTSAFLSEYSDVSDTHDLIPTDLSFEGTPPSVDYILSALSDGSLVPTPYDEDEPLWAQAMASNEQEYWIAGGTG